PWCCFFDQSMKRKHLPSAWRELRTAERQSRRIRAAVQRLTEAAPPDPIQSARLAGLRYVNDAATPGIRRIGRQNRFRYVDAAGRTLADRATVQRIRALAIPPAWTGVWICPNPLGHLQATGRD